MKAILILIAGALASCASFTRGDAIKLGTSLATASLGLAMRAANGEAINLKREAAKIGLELAGEAVARVEYNVLTPPTTSTAVVSASADVARAIIAKEATTPTIATKAAAIADQATSHALNNLNPTPAP